MSLWKIRSLEGEDESMELLEYSPSPVRSLSGPYSPKADQKKVQPQRLFSDISECILKFVFIDSIGRCNGEIGFVDRRTASSN